jgi:transposase
MSGSTARSANWTQAHLRWLGTVRFEQPGTQAAFDDYRGAVEALVVRRQELERQIAVLLPGSPHAQAARRLMCLRGIDTLTAAGLCAEIGDFSRFRHPSQVMSYLGVVPSESSSGSRRRQGSITKSGSQHARRLLVEAAWHYRRPPRVSEPLRRRQAGADPETVALAWKAQRRLHHVWDRLERRGKRRTIIAAQPRASSPASAGQSPPTDLPPASRWPRRRRTGGHFAPEPP